MTKQAFDKIAEGLKEAIAYAKEDRVDKELVRDTINLRFSMPYAPDHKAMATELSEQYHTFMDIAENSGYTVTKQEIFRSDNIMIVEVEGKKQKRN